MKYADNERFTLFHGDNRAILPMLPENSVDAIVTDPPYELGFMGKSWDASGVAFDPAMWREALRVLKPGGHLLAFSGSRTYHRIAVAIEDAGFEIRDQIMWIYGSGFPKSLDISKAVDKSDAAIARRERDLKFTAWMRSTGIKSSLINKLTISNMANHYLTDKEQPTVATAEMFDKLRPYLPEVPEWVEQMVRERTIESENFKKRQILGSKDSNLLAVAPGQDNDRSATTLDITAPATAEAKQWQGWGTALKPAHEPIVVARKPLIGTVAANVLTYGTGGLNIDASRVSGEPVPINKLEEWSGFGQKIEPEYEQTINNQGRWPANVIHDGSDEVVELFPETNKGVARIGKPGGSTFGGGVMSDEVIGTWYGDSGTAARFFYCAKTSKRDRNEGLEGFEEIRVHDGREEGGVGGSNPRNRSNNYRQNHHPTVKPTDLMRYLCRLVTPPNGVVLDPFTGSGSTGKAAMYERFTFIGIEMTEEYLPIAKARIEFAINDKEETLFDA